MALLLRQLWGLHTNVKQKAALAGIFSLGAIIVIIAIVRVVEIKATIQHVDPVWLALWSAIEASVAVIVSCLPSFRVFFLSTRTDSAYKRRNPSSSASSRNRPSQNRNNSIRLDAIRSGTFLDVGLNNRESIENCSGAERGGPSNTIISKSSKTESQEDILPNVPKDCVLVRQDWVSDKSPATP
ncbi:hypothetical protein MMC28_010967 [Mycoblastus sanguinarius]|nr:hypothetical protein [Mycoblastus sanguinarius]